MSILESGPSKFSFLNALWVTAVLAGGCDTQGEVSSDRGPLPAVGKADGQQGCAGVDVDYCGGEAPDGCWCDDQCTKFGDCCADIESACGVDACEGDGPQVQTPACAAVPASCHEIKAANPSSKSGLFEIDPDGAEGAEPFLAYCDMVTDGGGWTLVVVSSDDGVDTWSMTNRELLTTDATTIGLPTDRTSDFKSPALHSLAFRDLMFVHAPSEIWAAYGDVGDGDQTLAGFIADQPERLCDPDLAGHGYPMTAGTLTVADGLCDSDLYFNLGDLDGTAVNVAACEAERGRWANETFGPAWNTGFNNGCNFDDPELAGLGPAGPCERCDDAWVDREQTGRGFGGALGLNTAPQGAHGNRLEMYVR